MTKKQILIKLQRIRVMKHDPESAHGDLDELWEEVLRAIAGGCDDPAGLAKLALKAKDIDFPSWYA